MCMMSKRIQLTLLECSASHFQNDPGEVLDQQLQPRQQQNNRIK